MVLTPRQTFVFPALPLTAAVISPASRYPRCTCTSRCLAMRLAGRMLTSQPYHLISIVPLSGATSPLSSYGHHLHSVTSNRVHCQHLCTCNDCAMAADEMWHQLSCLQACIAARRLHAQHISKHTARNTGGSSSSSISNFAYSDIRSATVRGLVQPGDEILVIRPDPRISPVITPQDPKRRMCAGCQQRFNSLLLCGGCKSVEYCRRDCQKTHWRLQHKSDCEQLKTERLATRQWSLSSLPVMQQRVLQ